MIGKGVRGGGTRVRELYNNNTTPQMLDRGGAFDIHHPEYKRTLVQHVKHCGA